MPSAASLTGLMCRILLLSSVAYNDTNQITMEFSTPRFVGPQSMLFCFTSVDFLVDTQTLRVVRLSEGGSIFSVTETTVVSPSNPFASSAFFSSTGFYLDSLEVSTVYEVFGTDPFYAQSYLLQRYDDLVVDQQGTPIRGMVNFPVNPADPPGGSEFTGNCFLLTGAWKANTRYQMTIQVTNPPPPAAVEVPWPPPPPPSPGPPSPPRSTNTSPRPPPPPPAASPPPPPAGPAFMLFSNNATPIVWIAPITYTVGTYGNATNEIETLLFSVRGDKYGAACPLRRPIVPYMGTMFDACAESRKQGLGPQVNSTTSVSECLRRLRTVASQPANQNVLPFTAPPLTSYNLTSFRETTCPGAGTVLGPRFGGECISCGLYGVERNNTCSCPTAFLPNLVGNVSCGDPISPDANVTSLGALPAWLCANFTKAKSDWQIKELLDHNVAKQYVDGFTQLASSLLDETAVAAAYAVFNATLIFDDRRPNSPTRRWGIKPNCDECTGGQFKNVYTKQMVPVFDWHFDAMNTFRFIGYLLDQVLRSPCPALWDRTNPKVWNYGYYEEIICKPMPPNTCCGGNFQGNP